MYVASVAVLDVDHPKKVYPVLLNPFAVNSFDIPYVCIELFVVPVPPFALYTIVYVFLLPVAVNVTAPFGIIIVVLCPV